MSSLGIGLVGCGSMGRSLATEAQSLAPKASIVAVCDPDLDNRNKAAEDFDAAAFGDAADLLDSADVNAVIIATPCNTHSQLTVQAAAAGKHVFCEKPMALTVAECDQMIAACDEAGVKLMIGHVLRYIPSFAEMKRLIDAGEIGRPFAMQTTRVSGGWGGGTEKAWRATRETAGGILFEVSVHELDFMCWVLGEPKQVCCVGGHYVDQAVDYEDLMLLNITFGEDAIGHLAAGLAGAISTYDGKVWGTEGAFFHQGWGPVRVKRFDGDEREIDPKSLEYEHGVHREVREFVEAALEDKPVTIPGRDGRRAVAICEGAHQSLAAGQAVAIP